MISTKEHNLRKAIFFAIKMIAIMLVVCFFVEYPAQMVGKAADASKVCYISKIKTFQADSAEEAKKLCEGEGYICAQKNLNEGTGKDVVYMGYKLTEDKNKALYDIKLLQMNDGYQIKDYKEANEQLEKSNSGAAEIMYASATEFAFNYKKKSPKAIEAYEGLNLFNIPEANNAKLGEYIISKKADAAFFAKIISRASTGTINAITSFLSTGLTPMKKETDEETGERVDVTWASKVKESKLWDILEDENSSEDELNDYDKDYHDLAEAFFKQLQQFTTHFENGKAVFNENKYVDKVKNADMDEVVENADKASDADNAMTYVNAYNFLDEYEAYEDMPLGEYLVKIGKQTSGEVDLRKLYPILDSMTYAQREMVGMAGVMSVISNLGENTKAEEAENVIDKVRNKMKELVGSETVSIWMNANPEMADKKVAFTSDAIRLQSAGDMLDENATDNWEEAKKTVNDVFKWIGIGSSAITVLTFLGGKYGIAGAIVALKSATAIVSATASSVATKVIAISSIISEWAGIFSLWILAVTIIFYIVTLIVEYIKKHKAEKYTDMPDFVVDTREVKGNNTNVTYEAVKDNKGRIADLNAYEAQHGWVCMYVSDDPKSGSAIRADEDGNIFNIVYGDSAKVKGYDCVSYFGHINPGNCNNGAKSDDVHGIYVHYYTEKSIKNRPVTTADGGTTSASESSDKTTDDEDDDEKLYYGDLIVRSGKSPEIAKSKIIDKGDGYQILDQNLCPEARKLKLKEEQYTYIGYKVTSNPKNAIRDIRVATYSSGGSILFGDVSYSFAGSLGFPADSKSDNKDYPGDLDGLFYTKYENAGTPIEVGALHLVSSQDKAKAGWEPVTTFSGLPYNFATSRYKLTGSGGLGRHMLRNYSYTGYLTKEDNKWESVRSYLYYEPEETYTEGTKYLSGVFFAFAMDSEAGAGYHDATEALATEMFDNLSAMPNVEEASATKGVNIAESFFYKGYIADSNQKYMRMYYTWTYNPYRALTDVQMFRGAPYLPNLPYTISKAVSYPDKVSDGPNVSASYAAASVAVQRTIDAEKYVIRAVAPENAYMTTNGLLSSDGTDCVYEGFTREPQGKFKFSDSKLPWLPTNLYVTGHVKDRPRLTLHDVVISNTKHDGKSENGKITCDISGEKTLDGVEASGGFSSIQDLKDPHCLTAFNISYPSWTDDEGSVSKTDEENGSHFHKAGKPVYMYIRRENVKQRYISRIFVGASSREDSKSDDDDELEAYDTQVDLIAMQSALESGSDEMIHYDIAGDQSKSWYKTIKAGEKIKPPKKGDPAAYISVARTDDPDKAIKSLVLYKSDDKTAANQIKIDGAVYYCASNKKSFTMSNGKKYFLYYSHNQGTAPGKPFTDIDVSEDVFISARATALVVDSADVTELQDGEVVTKKTSKPYGDTSVESFIHGKYEAQTVYYNKIFTASGDTAKEAQLKLLEQGCTEFCNINLNKDAGGKYIYLGYRGFTLNEDKIDMAKTADAKEAEKDAQLQEAIYDIVCTVGEDFHPEGIMTDRYQIYYSPVAKQDGNGNLVGTNLNEGTTGPKIYMYYTTMYAVNNYNAKAKNDPDKMLSTTPKDYLKSPLTKIGFALNDYVPYSKDLEATTSGSKANKPWEYVLSSDSKSHIDLNEGAVAFDSKHMTTDNRITMFAQRDDYSVKKSAEITGGYNTALITENKLYITPN